MKADREEQYPQRQDCSGGPSREKAIRTFFWVCVSLCLKADSSYKSAPPPPLFLIHTHTNRHIYIPSLVPMLPCLIEGCKQSVVNVTMVKAQRGQRMAAMRFMCRDLEHLAHPGCTATFPHAPSIFSSSPRCLFLHIPLQALIKWIIKILG